MAVETGEVSNLSAEMGLVSFRTGEGVSPGRLLRVAHALARGCLLYLQGEPRVQLSVLVPSGPGGGGGGAD